MDSGTRRPTIGFISTWPVYQSATIDRHAHAFLDGVLAAARDRGCSLLIGAGASDVADRRLWRTVWPAQSPQSDLVPVGPWNADGLVVIADDLSEAQTRYIEDLGAAGLPVVCTTPEAPGPKVVVDNIGGIRQAVGHLIEHGHRCIAFVAGREHLHGDSAERLHAFRVALTDAGLDVDDRLIAYGDHSSAGGERAMALILDRGASFSAVVASNDLSCIGAVRTLRAAGRRVPDDVAAIGFDDVLGARSHTPSLTTVRHPTFAHGYDSVITLLDRIAGSSGSDTMVEPTRLIIRESCGCRPDRSDPIDRDSADPRATLSQLMARAAYDEARHSTLAELDEGCGQLLDALLLAVIARSESPLRDEVLRLLTVAEARGEDAHVWQAAMAVLFRNAVLMRRLAPTADQAVVLELLDHARVEVTERARRGTQQVLIEHMDMMSRLGRLTSQLLATRDTDHLARILAQDLPGLGIEHALVCIYEPDEEDPGAVSEVVLSTGLPEGAIGQRFRTRAFPPPGLYRADVPMHLIVLPLRVDDLQQGFVALSATSLEPAAAIVSNLAAAMRASRLFRDALEGRRLAEEASTVKSRFLSMVSHELRTPLSVVVGLSDMILREAESGDVAPAITSDLQRMAASAEHLGHLINDVLDLANSDAGQLRLEIEPVDLAAALQASVSAGRQLAHAKGLAFEAELPPRGPWVMADAGRIGQVCLNLLSNAAKFTDEGHVWLSVTELGRRVTVSVGDTGIGVPAGDRELIFDEFQRSGRSQRQGRGGLGLGLAIARQLMTLQGGSIEARSPGPDGRGSVFSFSLPVCSARNSDGGTAESGMTLKGSSANLVSSASDAPGGGDAIRRPVVLVVDDDADARDLHARIVADVGGRAMCAADGASAIAALEAERPDLVLLDLGLPDMDGVHVLERLRARRSTHDVPVIVVTGRSHSEDSMARLQPGVSSILSKGVFSPAETRARIEVALSGRRALGGPTQQLVRRAVAYLEDHHAEQVSRELVARHVAISPDYLTDCFAQELGVTPMVYLTRCRIRHARELLETTDQSVTAVAMAVGFSDVSHFTRTFHREVGVSPRAYRRGGPPGS